MENEYVIINKSVIQKRIEELNEEYIKESEEHMKDWFLGQIESLKQILSQSTPLIPEIEKAFDTGRWGAYATGEDVHSAEEYSLNLKLDI